MAVYGWDIVNSGLNQNLFCRLSLTRRKSVSGSSFAPAVPPFLSGVTVVGRIVSSSLSTSANWESALEGKGADSTFSSTSALLQSGSASALINGKLATDKFVGKTLVGINESLQVWRGEEPLTANITLEFLAVSDSYKEVELPIQYLHMFKAPRLREGVVSSAISSWQSFIDSNDADNSALGDVPFDLNVSIFNKRFNASFVLESVSEDEDEIKRDARGGRIRQEVSLSLKSSRAINRGGTLGTSDIKFRR